MRKGDSAGALEGLPLQMIVILVVVAIVVSGVFLSWTSSDAQRTEANLRAALQSLATVVKDVADPSFFGPANFTLVLEDGAFAKITSVVVGGVFGSPAPEDFLLRYRLSSGHAGSVTSSYRVWSATEPLALSPGRIILHLDPASDPDPEVGVYVNITASR